MRYRARVLKLTSALLLALALTSCGVAAAPVAKTPTAVPSPTPKSPAVATPSPPQQEQLTKQGVTAGNAVEVERGNSSLPRVALTFDAGGGSEYVSKILDILGKHGVRSTFFITGRWAEENPEALRQIVAAGHELGNHSYSHPSFTTLSDSEIAQELDKTEAIVRGITGKSTKPFFRPPFGDHDDRVRETVARNGYVTVYWTLDSTDWRPEVTAAQVLRRVVSNTSNGYIVVQHVNSPQTAEALEGIVIGLKEKGLTMVSLSELLAR